MLRAATSSAIDTRCQHLRAAAPAPARLLANLRVGQKVLVKSYQSSNQGGYYPPVPPAYTPAEPSAPYSDTSYGSGYGSPTNYDSSYAPSEVGSPTAEELAAVAEQDALRASAPTTRTLSWLGFWAQFALSIVSAGILLFSTAFVPQAVGGNAVVNVSKYLTLAGVIFAFISSLMAHGFLTLSRKLVDGGIVKRGYLVTTLLTNNGICLAGIFATVIGLQASVGTLVAKSLMSAMSGPYTTTNAANALVSLDVFALQASTNTLLCHVLGLLFTNLMLRVVNRATTSSSSGGGPLVGSSAKPVMG